MSHSAIVPRLLRVFHFTTGKPGALCPVISPTTLCMGSSGGSRILKRGVPVSPAAGA